MNIAPWPYDQPERELELLSEALGKCRTQDEVTGVLSAFLLMDALTEIMTTPPAWRERWWQFWRMRRPR